MILVWDVEANNLLYEVSKIHCISTVDILTGKTYHFTDIPAGLLHLDGADMIIGHNICCYDIPALKKLYGWVCQVPVCDTLLLSNILFPEEKKPSLEYWAWKLGLQVQKVAHEDWSTYSPEMKIRCDSDVQINWGLYKFLMSNQHIQQALPALQLEQQVATLHAKQTLHGVVVDQDKLWCLIDGLDRHLDKLEGEIVPLAPWKCKIKGVAVAQQEDERKERTYQCGIKGGKLKYTEAFKKDGAYTVATKNYFGKDYLKVKGPYTKIELLPLNLRSDTEVKGLLMDLGWRPMDWNFKVEDDGTWTKKSPKLTEESYVSLPTGLGKKIARFNTLKHRRQGLLSKDMKGGVVNRIRSDGRVPAEGFTCGTPTARYRHSGAICNIPRITSPYGRGLRGLYGVAKGNWQVGIDLSGIEARLLAHYLLLLNFKGAKKTADLILSPDKGNDFHSYNAKVWGCSRDTAKTVLYALLYGAGAAKLARTLGIPDHQGQSIKDGFYKAHPAIKKLIDMLEAGLQKNGGKFIWGMDGRPLYVRKKNALLNTLLQNAAAIVFKKWMVRCGEERPEWANQFIA